jgi:hypothetical protein
VTDEIFFAPSPNSLQGKREKKKQRRKEKERRRERERRRKRERERKRDRRRKRKARKREDEGKDDFFAYFVSLTRFLSSPFDAYLSSQISFLSDDLKLKSKKKCLRELFHLVHDAVVLVVVLVVDDVGTLVVLGQPVAVGLVRAATVVGVVVRGGRVGGEIAADDVQGEVGAGGARRIGG